MSALTMRLKTLEMSGFKSFVDRTTIQFEDGITGVVGPNGCGKCVHGDTLISLSSGSVVPIRTLVEDAFKRAESVEHIDDGEYTYDNPECIHVLSLDRQTFKMTTRPVLAFVRRTAPAVLLKITTKSGRSITATEYHPFFIQEGGELRPARADELRVGLHVAAPRFLPMEATHTHFMAIAETSSGKDGELMAVDNMLVTKGVRTKPLQVVTQLTPEWGRFLGYIISEGQNSIWSSQVRFTNGDSSVIDDYCNTTRALFGRKPVCKDYKKGSKDCLLFSSILCDLLEQTFGIHRGGHSSTKKVPALIFGSEDDVAWSFLSALIEGDGCVRIEHRSKKHVAYLEYATASEQLARGVATLLLRFGVRSMIRSKRKRAMNSTSPAQTYYSVYVYGTENLKKLALGLHLVSKKQNLLHEAANLAEPAASFDIIPNVTPLFKTLWNESQVSISKNHQFRGRTEVYRNGGCNPSRKGLSEAVGYVREHAKVWNECTEDLSQKIEKLAYSEIYWDEIHSVERVNGEEWVYDLCVEGDHNFVANDIFVHNSNIVDAIRWVMGEMSAKHLRGSEMQDVIFNGCETRPPVGMAQVFLTFDNSDGRAPAEYASYSEIQIGRRLYRSGESEYFINKTLCRLKDIVDIFLGTGVGTKAYSIVEQGMVGQIVSARPEERRMLIEEAAGISKFKSRKEAALRKMEATRTNLARLNDILGELTRQINSLGRQAKKAERYQLIHEELKGRELALAATKHRAMRVELENLVLDNDRLSETCTSKSAELSKFETELETMRLDLLQTERELDGVQQDLYRTQHSIKLAEAEISHRTKEQASILETSELYSKELEDLHERLTALANQIDNANSALVAADLKLAGSADVTCALETGVTDLRSQVCTLRDEVDILKRQVMEDDNAVSNTQASLEHLGRRQVDITGRIARDQAEIDAVDKRQRSLSDEMSSFENALAGSLQLKLKLAEEAELTQASLLEQRTLLANAESDLAAKRDAAADCRLRLSSLKELRKNLEGYRDGVRAVLSRADNNGAKLEGVLGTVSEFIETDAEFEPALGAVLGEKLQYVVVKSHSEGIDAIDYLKSAASGRSTFIPLSVRATVTEDAMPEGEGVIGPITNFVRFTDDYRKICQHLLDDVVLVENLQRALDLWSKGTTRRTLVTRDGCVVDPSGIVTGGSSAGVEEQLIAGRRKIKELEGELLRLSKEVTSAEGEAIRFRERVKFLEENVEALKCNTHGKELHLVGQERDLARAKEDIARCDTERDRLTIETAALSEELRQIEQACADAQMCIEQHTANRDRTQAKLGVTQEGLVALSLELENKERELIDLKVALAQAKERQSSVERELVGLLESRIETILGIDRRTSDIALSNNRLKIVSREIEIFKRDLDLSIRSVGHLQESQRILQERYGTDSSVIRDKELSIREIRKHHDEALSSFHSTELRLTEHRSKMQYLGDSIRERYRVDITSVENECAKDDLDTDAEEAIVTELKEKIDKIGPVNVDAIKEFDELSKRQVFLEKQNADLFASLDNLSKAIAKINRTSRQRFRRAFDEVDQKFQQLFPKLFRGGGARLMLTDEENLLETGIEIIAQPPGKKLQSITLLSGGEKALTAVALIFSIFLIKPSPFCLLDEVDAPLDDANVDRFNDLIRSMTPHSQFILITHNKRTMELADLLYGVTMQERGVSTMVSVKLGSDDQLSHATAVA